MLRLYLQLSTIYMFIFISYQLYVDTGYDCQDFTHHSVFLVASLPSLPRLCCYDLTHKTSVSIAAPVRFEGLGRISNLKNGNCVSAATDIMLLVKMFKKIILYIIV